MKCACLTALVKLARPFSTRTFGKTDKGMDVYLAD